MLLILHKRRKRGGGEGGQGGGGGGGQAPNNVRGGQLRFGPPTNNPSTFSFNVLYETGKNHKCTKLKGKIIINVTFI